MLLSESSAIGAIDELAADRVDCLLRLFGIRFGRGGGEPVLACLTALGADVGVGCTAGGLAEELDPEPSLDAPPAGGASFPLRCSTLLLGRELPLL